MKALRNLLKGQLLLLCLFLLAIDCHAAFEEGCVEIVVPLRNDRFYSLHTFLSQCNSKLGAKYRLDEIPEKEMELSNLERAAVRLASDAGLVNARFEANRLTLSIPDNQDDATRRRIRDRLGRLMGVPLNQWPAHLGLHVPKDFDSAKRTIVLTHGLEGGSTSLRPMQLAFERSGVQVVIYDFPNDGPIAWSGDRLSKELIDLATRYPSLRLVVVAHSMGGLVARYALETPGKNPGCVADLFLLGTPNQGSRLSGAQPWLEFLLDVLPRPLRLADALTDGLGEAADDLLPGSRFLTALNARERTAGVRYHSIIGRKSFVSDQQRVSIEKELKGILEQRGVPAEKQRGILDLVNAEELQDGHGDGAVTVANTRLMGVRDEKVFDLNHVQLLIPLGPPGTDGEVVPWILSTLGWEKR
jgi:pimeloyl-ACP methyl ester carboxylesterase